MARGPPKLCRNMQSWNVELEYFQPLSDPKNSDQRASHAIAQAGNVNEDDQTREMNDEDQATDMHEEDQTRDMEETEMDISENEIQEQNEVGDMKLQLVFLKLQRIFSDRIEHDPKGFKQALTTFNKHLDQMPKSNDAVLQKALCTFGQDSIAPLKLAKRKMILGNGWSLVDQWWSS